nr:ATP synthase F0 subunit 8 [Ulochaetes vacca]
MPQMAPMNWMILFIYFVMIFFMVNIFNYFSFCYLKNKKLMIKDSNCYNWKW